jgi:hypothetical protein
VLRDVLSSFILIQTNMACILVYDLLLPANAQTMMGRVHIFACLLQRPVFGFYQQEVESA